MNNERAAVDLLREKRFLGQEFLTWLWFKSEERGGMVFVPGEGDFLVAFERFIVLEAGEGEASETLTCRGLRADLREARTGLKAGKKVARVHFRLGRGDDDWRLTLRGDTLDVSALRVRKGMRPGDEEWGDQAVEARVLERAFLLEQAMEAVDLLFRTFLVVRLDRPSWEEERQRLRHWLTRE